MTFIFDIWWSHYVLPTLKTRRYSLQFTSIVQWILTDYEIKKCFYRNCPIKSSSTTLKSYDCNANQYKTPQCKRWVMAQELYCWLQSPFQYTYCITAKMGWGFLCLFFFCKKCQRCLVFFLNPSITENRYMYHK